MRGPEIQVKICKYCGEKVVIDTLLNKIIKQGSITCGRCEKEWYSYIENPIRGERVIIDGKRYVKFELKNTFK